MYEGNKPDEVMLGTEDLFADLPEQLRDINIPPSERAKYRQSIVKGLVDTVQEQLDNGQESYIRGQDGVLVSDIQFRELQALVGGLRINPSDLVKRPSPEDADTILAKAYQIVDETVHEDYKDGARKELEAITPKFAGTIDDAANAFSAKLPERPRE